MARRLFSDSLSANNDNNDEDEDEDGDRISRDLRKQNPRWMMPRTEKRMEN